MSSGSPSASGAGRGTLSVREHGRLLACRQHVLLALCAAAEDRSASDWVERERVVVATSANAWAQAHGYPQRVTVDDVERIEVQAVGHVDYASKLALYIAEFVVLGSDDREVGS